MLKRLASLLLSLLLCLTLLPGQARAADNPQPIDQPAQTEPMEPEAPEEPVVLLAEEIPDEYDSDHY